jgi:hypothetical protein
MTTTTTLGDATLAELRSTITGTVTVPGDPDYETARRTWNYAIDRHPALIMRCTGTADVVAGVQFARSEALPIACVAAGTASQDSPPATTVSSSTYPR